MSNSIPAGASTCAVFACRWSTYCSYGTPSCSARSVIATPCSSVPHTKCTRSAHIRRKPAQRWRGRRAPAPGRARESRVEVGGQVRADHVTEVERPVRVGQRARDDELLGHGGGRTI